MAKHIDDKFTEALGTLKKYQYRGVANRAYLAEDEDIARGALKKYAKDGQDPEYNEDFIDFTLSSPEGIEYASLKNKKFPDALDLLPIGILTDKYYSGYIDKYANDKNKDVLKNLLKEYKDRTYGDITEKYKEALDIVKAKSKKYSEDDKRKALDTMKEYENIIGALELMEESRYESLRPKAADESLGLKYNEFAERLTKKR